ncbi:DUF6090 family protein [Algoriphagus sp.]|uniref:DUF6090 family protein n=1 Tax=Algoriphagus sp. TaxID=1872435 RepID=UPI00262CDB79|nr:DUF6090 family protein [Algoriphagus sp.]
MLKFFRTIRKKLIKQDTVQKPTSSAGKYLLYALGEILLVVMGILIALQVNTWNENKVLKRQEKVYLKLLKDDLSLQLEENQLQHSFLVKFKEDEERLTEFLAKRFQVEETQRPEVKLILTKLVIGRTYGIYDATYLDLTSSGNLVLISDQVLKNKIIQHYQIQHRDRNVINNNELNTFKELWTKLVDRNVLLLNPRFNELLSGNRLLEQDPRIGFLDKIYFKNLAEENNLILIRNVMAYKIASTTIGLSFLEESNIRIAELMSEIEPEL